MSKLYGIFMDGTDVLVTDQVFTTKDKASNALERHAVKKARQSLINEGYSREAVRSAEFYQQSIDEAHQIRTELKDSNLSISERHDLRGELDFRERDAKMYERCSHSNNIDPTIWYGRVEVWCNLLQVQEVQIVRVA